MTATQTSTKEQFLPVRTLFYPYSVCVLSLAFLLILKLLNYDFSRLPQQPGDIVILSFFLELPHIVASHVLMADREYIDFYKTKLFLRYVVVCAILIATTYAFGIAAFYSIYFMWTVYHVLKQQVGIGRIMNRQASKLYEAWGYVLIVGSLVLAALIGYYDIELGQYRAWLLPTVFGFAGVITVLAIVTCLQLKQLFGRWYVAANTGMYLSVLACIVLGAPFFVIFIPRIIHDMTAYLLYINHDANRNSSEKHNVLYREFWFLPAWGATLFVSITLASLVTFHVVPFAIQIGIGLTISHYILESFVWRGTGIHRKSLRLRFT